MSHNAWSTPDNALFRTGPLRQDELAYAVWWMSSISLGSRPTRNGSRYSWTAVTTVSGRWVNVAQPSPYRPGSLVSTLTMTRRMPSGAVHIGRTRVMRSGVMSVGSARDSAGSRP